MLYKLYRRPYIFGNDAKSSNIPKETLIKSSHYAANMV